MTLRIRTSLAQHGRVPAYQRLFHDRPPCKDTGIGTRQ